MSKPARERGQLLYVPDIALANERPLANGRQRLLTLRQLSDSVIYATSIHPTHTEARGMFRKVEDFQKAWKYEAEMTGKVLTTLTDASLGQKVTPDGRTLGFLGWHLTLTLGEMLGHVGLKIDAPEQDAECPSSAAEIAAAYEKAAKSVAEEVNANWTDEALLQEDNMYGETWSRGLTLFYFIAHQAHHRGQMTVLMRQAGLLVPGIYGPAREEWAAMGAP